ncbi:Hsp20 family protein [Streptomyces sp. NPDC058740]
MPSDVEAEDVTATMADGTPTVTSPRTEAGKPRHIEITSG